MKTLLKVVFQCNDEDVFKNALWTYVELLSECDEKEKMAAALCFILPYPDGLEL